ncbi:MAG: cyanophycinase [Betaproteobacteria bacterium]|nr:MAG: cyanophycinase [Betaproteobacteria bacterium]
MIRPTLILVDVTSLHASAIRSNAQPASGQPARRQGIVWPICCTWLTSVAMMMGYDVRAAGHESKSVEGTLVIMGGAIHPDTEDIWQRIVALAGGSGAQIAVIAAAAASPESSAERTIAVLKRYGAAPFFVPAAPRLATSDFRKMADDKDLAQRVAAAGGVFFNGGDQSRITQTLLRADGKRTALLEAIWSVYERGGVLAGTSAGAAIMSETMFYEPPDVLSVLQNPLRQNRDIAPGLGFVGAGVFIDQHVLARGRFARMLPAMAAAKVTLGIGVDENAAVAVSRDGTKRRFEVLGASGVIVLDTSRATSNASLSAFNVRGARLSYLERGDHFDLNTRVMTPSAFKLGGTILDPAHPNYKPEFDEPRWYADALSKNGLVEIMCNLIDNTPRQVVAMALPPPHQTNRDLGFEFTFRKAPGTLGYLRIDKGRAHYSVKDIVLDVLPVKVTAPLYGAL